MANYFLSDGIKKWGPLSKEEIFNRLDTGQISLFDLICGENEKEFVPLMNHDDFTRDSSDSSASSDKKEHVHGLMSTGLDNEYTRTRLKGVMSNTTLDFDGLREKTSTQSENDDLKEDEWFIITDAKEKGPHSFLGIVGMLASGHIKEFDYVKNGATGQPQKIAEVPEFQPEHLARFKETDMGPKLEGKAFRRAHERYQINKKIFLYDRSKFYKVICVEMSLGGAGLLTGRELLNVNDEVFLKFHMESNVDTFDAKGKVVSMRKVRVANREEKYFRYGIQFTGLSEEGEEFLKQNMSG